MILVITRMKVIPDKRKELSQAMISLVDAMRMKAGCGRFEFCQNVEKENEFCLLEEWDAQDNLIAHLKSEHFRIIRGAMNLLEEPYERMFHTVFHPAGMEEIGRILSRDKRSRNKRIHNHIYREESSL